MDRRHFLLSSLTATGAARASGLASPNDTVRIALVGLRGRGRDHIQSFSKVPKVQIAAICDVDESILAERLADVERVAKTRPATFTDVRRVLEDKSIDAIAIATPNHSHTLQTIWGCQAGKDVYVEKPCSHNVFEARQIVAAARKYNRMVQHGTNGRSSVATREAAQKLREGVVGDLYMARGLCYKWRDTIGRAPAGPAPAGVHYDLWLGPAPKREFTKNRFHYNFHWFWDYGNGDIGNQGAHQIDTARWLLGVKYPTKVSAIGGHFMFDDDQETPNTMTASFEFNEGGKKKMLVFEVRHWMSNHEAGIGERAPGSTARPSADDSNTIGDIYYGSNGYMVIGGGYKTFLGRKQEPGPSSSAPGGDNFANFIDAMRSRKISDLNAEIEEGAASTVLIHLANISYRLGRTLNFDGASMTCKGDAEANRMFTRNYRAPFVVPEKGMTVSRRAFLGAAAIGGSSSLAAGRPAMAGSGPPFHLGATTYNVLMDWDLDKILQVLPGLGFEAVELRTTHKHGVEPSLGRPERLAVRKKFEAGKLRLISYGTVCEFHAVDPTVRAKNVETGKQWVLLAEDTGAMAIRVRPNGLPRELPVETTIRNIAACLRELGEFGAGRGIEIWMEVHGPETQNPPIAAAIMRAASHQNVGVCWNSNPTDVVDGSVKASFDLLGPYIKNVHINELADERYPWRELFALLRRAGYSRYTLCEAQASKEPERFLRWYKALWTELCRPAA